MAGKVDKYLGAYRESDSGILVDSAIQLVEGDNITLTVNQQADTVTISSSGGGSTYTGSENVLITNDNKIKVQLEQQAPYGWDFSKDVSWYTANPFNFSSIDNEISGIYRSHDGSAIYLLGKQHLKIYKIDMSIPYDLSTASYNGKNADISAKITNPGGLYVFEDENQLAITDIQTKKVVSYTLTSGDLSTLAFDKEITINVENLLLTSIDFKPDGTLMNIAGNDSVTGYPYFTQYTLTTARDISTFSNPVTMSIPQAAGTIFNSMFGDSGQKMYVMGFMPNNIMQVTPSTPWVFNPADFQNIEPVFKDLSTLDSTCMYITLSNDGLNAYLYGGTNTSVFRIGLKNNATTPEGVGYFDANGVLIANPTSKMLTTNDLTNELKSSYDGAVSAISSLVPNTRTVNGKTLSSDVALTTDDIADTTDKRYCTDVEKTIISNISGTNTGDETNNSILTKLGVSTLSGSNTGDETSQTIINKLGYTPADDSGLVHKTGSETITGGKEFSGQNVFSNYNYLRNPSLAYDTITYEGGNLVPANVWSYDSSWVLDNSDGNVNFTHIAGSTTDATTSFKTTAGNYYICQFTLDSNITTGTFNIIVGGMSFSPPNKNGVIQSGTYKFAFYASTETEVILRPSVPAIDGTIKNILLYKLTDPILPIFRTVTSQGSVVEEKRNIANNYFRGAYSGQLAHNCNYNEGNGDGSLQNLWEGNYNQGYGYNSMHAMSVGYYNVGIGGFTLSNGLFCNYSTAIGYGAGSNSNYNQAGIYIGADANSSESGYYAQVENETVIGTFLQGHGSNTVTIGNSSVTDNYFNGAVHIPTLQHTGTLAGFFGTIPTTKPTINGSRGGNYALGSLLSALANLGLIVDSTTE